MAIRLDASGDFLSRASVATETSFTVTGWSTTVANVGSGSQPIAIITRTFGSNVDTWFDWHDASGTGSGMTMGSWDGGGAATTNFATRPAVGDQYYWYMKCAGTGANLLEAGWRRLSDAAYVTGTQTIGPAAIGTGTLRLGDDGFGGWSNIRYAAIKIYNRALSAAEIEGERFSFVPRVTNGLTLWAPMVHSTITDAVKDFSGAGANLTANGTLTIEAGPPILWRPRRPTLILPTGAPANITGVLNVSEVPDAAVFNANAQWQAVLNATEAPDVAAFNATIKDPISGVLNVTEAADTAAFNASVTDPISGVLNVTEAPDTAAFNARVSWAGVLNVTEAPDTAVFTGTVAWTAVLNATEAPDTAAFTANVRSNMVLAATEAPDTASFTGAVRWTMVLNATEAPDVAAFSGSLAGAGVAGSLNATEAPDVAAFTGTITGNVGVLAVTEARDVASFLATVRDPIGAILVASEAPDVAAFTGGIVLPGITGYLAASERPDTVQIIAQTRGDAPGVLNFGRRVTISRW